MNRRFIVIGVGVLLIIGFIVGGYFAFRRTLIADVREAAMNVDTSDTIAYGEVLFETRGCSGCHQLDSIGAAGNVGPNLTTLHVREDAAYITQSIREPNAVIAADCPEEACEADTMPMYGSILNETQIAALTAFLIAQPE